MYQATLETLYMCSISAVISFLIALPLGTLTSETRPCGMMPSRVINLILNRLIDLGRAIPFVLLTVFLFPITRIIVGSAIGTNAMIVPLVVCAVPFEARLVEEIISSVPKYIEEAASLDGANKVQIIIHMKWHSKLPYLVNSFGISVINIIGQSAIAGIVGGGGLGNYAIVYGFQRFKWIIIFKSVCVIIAIVVIVQIITNLIVRRLQRR